MKKDLTDKEKEERMNYLTIHKCKNEDERKELKELCDWYFKDTPTLTMSFSLTEEDFRVTMERDVELSEVARAVKNQHHKKKTPDFFCNVTHDTIYLYWINLYLAFYYQLLS